MHTLLIWEEVPENTVLFLIPNTVLTEDERTKLKAAHGCYINHDEYAEEVTESLNYINDALCEKEEHCSKEGKKGGWATKWFKHKVIDTKVPLENVSVTHVYRCGWIM